MLTAGASTNDILHQYVSTIKALRTIDPTGVFLEAVGEPIRDYLRGRKDTIKCIVTMLTDGSGGNANGTGNAGDNLLEELNRDAENQENVDYDDHTNIDEKQAWLNAERYICSLFLELLRNNCSFNKYINKTAVIVIPTFTAGNLILWKQTH